MRGERETRSSALYEHSDLHPVRSVSAGLSRYVRAGWPVEFVLSHSLFILWRIEDYEMVDKVTRSRRSCLTR